MSGPDRARPRAVRFLAAAGALAVVAGCTIGAPVDATIGIGLEPAGSLTEPGTALATDVDWSSRPRYHVVADLDPVTGTVVGQWTATLPVAADDDEVDLFFMPLLSGLANEPSVDDVTVDGQPVDGEVSRPDAMITVPLAVQGRTTVDIAMTFSYELGEVELAPPSSWDPDDPTEPDAGTGLGVLARHDDGLTLGSWFPMHAYAAADATSVRRTGNVPAAQFSVRLSVPLGYAVITSGVRTMSFVEADRLIVLEQAFGSRQLAVMVHRDAITVTRQVGATSVQVHAPTLDEADARAVLDDAASSLTALEDAFGPYPWRELDIVSVPIGGDIGGLAWPGMVWIDSTLMTSGYGIVGESRRWAVAHELGHQWWGMQVSSDPLFEPVLDEALAQYAACTVHRTVWPKQGEKACEEWITDVYLTMRESGFPDGVVNKLIFASPEQQNGLTYGKAPHVLLELGEEYGDAELLAALAEFNRVNAFGIAGDGVLADYLGESLGDPDAVAEIWHRWMLEINGDEDLDFTGG